MYPLEHAYSQFRQFNKRAQRAVKGGLSPARRPAFQPHAVVSVPDYASKKGGWVGKQSWHQKSVRRIKAIKDDCLSKHSERLTARCETLELSCVSSTSCASLERKALIGRLASVLPGRACEECVSLGTCIEKRSGFVPNAPE